MCPVADGPSNQAAFRLALDDDWAIEAASFLRRKTGSVSAKAFEVAVIVTHTILVGNLLADLAVDLPKALQLTDGG